MRFQPRARAGPGFFDPAALDADSKLIISYLVSERTAAAAQDFMDDVASRVVDRVQITTDGYRAYRNAVGTAFDWNVDHAMLNKIYGPEMAGPGRYSPPACIGVKVESVVGNANPAHISTSFVERNNLTMRMGMRRFTRLTNGFSKKIDNLLAAIALHFMHYNFCRVHKTLRVTPAMEAGLTDHVWDVEEIVRLLKD